MHSLAAASIGLLAAIWNHTAQTAVMAAAGNSFNDDLALLFSCTEDSSFPFLASGVPWDCAQYATCMGSDVIFLPCPAGKIWSSSTLRCGWPSPRQVTRCYGDFEDESHMTAATRGGGSMLECPYPSLFSTHTRSCRPFHLVTAHSCPMGRVPKAPCDYQQYHQLSQSPLLCQLRHPSCVRMRDGWHPEVQGPGPVLYIKRCFRERTVDVISCAGSDIGSLFSKDDYQCSRHVYDGGLPQL